MIKSLNIPKGIIVIRQASPADAIGFRELRLGALLDSPTAFSMDYDKAAQQPLKYWQDSLTLDDNESTILFAEHEGQLIGMTGIARGRSPKTRHAADIWGVYVAPSWRGLHIAEELIRSCCSWATAHGIVIARLGVTATNRPAIRCYERCGFKIYATESQAMFYEGKYLDFYMMSITLDE
jgi:RimJ/RimL family protein N-acetyltransferase